MEVARRRASAPQFEALTPAGLDSSGRHTPRVVRERGRRVSPFPSFVRSSRRPPRATSSRAFGFARSPVGCGRRDLQHADLLPVLRRLPRDVRADRHEATTARVPDRRRQPRLLRGLELPFHSVAGRAARSRTTSSPRRSRASSNQRSDGANAGWRSRSASTWASSDCSSTPTSCSFRSRISWGCSASKPEFADARPGSSRSASLFIRSRA